MGTLVGDVAANSTNEAAQIKIEGKSSDFSGKLHTGTVGALTEVAIVAANAAATELRPYTAPVTGKPEQLAQLLVEAMDQDQYVRLQGFQAGQDAPKHIHIEGGAEFKAIGTGTPSQ